MLEQFLFGRRSLSRGFRLFRSRVNFYTPPEEPELSGFDLPASGAQFHMHTEGDQIIGGSIKSYDPSESVVSLDNVQIAMGDLYAKNLGLKPIDFSEDSQQ